MARAAIAAKAIPFSQWKGQAVAQEVFGALQRQQAIYIQTLRLTTATWRHKVVFVPHIRFRGGGIELVIETDDKVWNWLNRGTSVRYATMRRGFVSKTRPGRLLSTAGRNPDPYKRGRKAGPHPGIEARQWTRLITRQRQAFFAAAMQDAVARGLAKGFKTP